jgi:hypothetical protein
MLLKVLDILDMEVFMSNGWCTGRVSFKDFVMQSKWQSSRK